MGELSGEELLILQFEERWWKRKPAQSVSASLLATKGADSFKAAHLGP